MFRVIFVSLLLVGLHSCNAKTDTQSYENKKEFRYKNFKLSVPEYFKATKIKWKWINENDGITLNIEKEFSKISINEYVNKSLDLIKNFYPSYELQKTEKISKDKVMISFSLTKDYVKIKFIMFVFAFEDCKIVITLAGKENSLNRSNYLKFIEFLKQMRVDNEGNKKDKRIEKRTLRNEEQE